MERIRYSQTLTAWHADGKPPVGCVRQTAEQVCVQRRSCDKGNLMPGTLHHWVTVTATASVSTPCEGTWSVQHNTQSVLLCQFV